MKAKTQASELPVDGDDAFRLEEFLPYRLSVTSNHVSRMFARRYADKFGLTIPEWRVLAVVGRYGSLSPSKVGDLSAMDKVKVSRAASALVKRGLLRQSQDPNDGRGRLLRLTRKGNAIHTDAIPLAREIEGLLSAGLSRAEWVALNKALVKLNNHALSIDGPDDGSSED
jgi:DNA-binding MarR family transcriptional regulator